MSILNPRLGMLVNQRRSQRVVLSVPLEISGKRPNGSPFEESTSTIVVNADGALVPIRERVLSGQKLLVKNLATGEGASCLVKDISAGQNGIPEIGFEFAEPHPRFWRVSFPPSDWNTRSPEAKRYSTPITAASKSQK